jgi:hypothetical protein
MSYTSVDYNGVYANPDNQYADLKKYNTIFGPKPLPQPNQSHPTLLQQPNPFGYDALSHGNGDAYYNVKTGYGTNCDQKYYTGMCPSNKRVGPFPPRPMKENYGSDEYVLSGCDANLNFQCVPSSQGKSIEYDEVMYQTQSECMFGPKHRCLEDPNFVKKICPNDKDDSCVAAFIDTMSRDQIVANCCPNSK